METHRKQRYSQKIAELDDRVGFIEENLGNKDKFIKDRTLRKAIYKEFQELVEIISDISAMMVKDQGKVVEDDYSNLEKLSKILDNENLIGYLKEATGLRNVLVHEYNGVVDMQAYTTIKKLISKIAIFGSEVEKWLRS